MGYIKDCIDPPDVFYRLASVSKEACDVFDEIILKVDPKTGIAVMSNWNDYTPEQKRKLDESLVELQDAGVFIRVNKVKNIANLIKSYAILANPDLFCIQKESEAKELWKINTELESAKD